MQIHREKGTVLGGVHLELTGELNAEGYSVVRFVSFQEPQFVFAVMGS